jgi:aryl-alcohol dehydrogenase-like predicted oxidoreductase
MKKRKLGNLEVSSVGIGCMGLSHTYGAAMEKVESIHVLQQACEMGYTFFDTAESYTGMSADGSISYDGALAQMDLLVFGGH